LNQEKTTAEAHGARNKSTNNQVMDR